MPHELSGELRPEDALVLVRRNVNTEGVSAHLGYVARQGVRSVEMVKVIQCVLCGVLQRQNDT